MTSDRPTVPRMFPYVQGWNWSGNRTRAASRPAAGVRRPGPRRRFQVEQLESRWLLSTTSVIYDDADSGFTSAQGVELFSPVQLANLPPTDEFLTAIALPE